MAATAMTIYVACTGCPSGRSLCNPVGSSEVSRCTCVNLVGDSDNAVAGVEYSVGTDQLIFFDGADCTVGR